MENLVRAFGYDKFKGAPRVLVFELKYPLVADIIENMHEMGWSVRTVSTRMVGKGDGGFIERLLTTALEHKPDFLLTINHGGFDEDGALAGILSSLEIPLASWFVDHPMPILGGAEANANGWTQVFSFERTSLEWLAGQGFEDPSYLPTGANPLRFHPEKVEREMARTLGGDLVFVGNSWWTKTRVDPPEWIREIVTRVTSDAKVGRVSLRRGGLEERVAGLIGGAGGRRGRYLVSQAALAEASMLARAEVISALVPLGVRVHGDPGWLEMVPGVDLRPYVDYGTQLPSLFAGTGINLNVTAEQMPTAVNQRVWDVPACGGFLLTDFREDLAERFDAEREIASYETPDEAADKARWYAAHEEERRAVALAAHERVFAEHLLAHRLETLAAVMRRRFG